MNNNHNDPNGNGYYQHDQNTPTRNQDIYNTDTSYQPNQAYGYEEHDQQYQHQREVNGYSSNDNVEETYELNNHILPTEAIRTDLHSYIPVQPLQFEAPGQSNTYDNFINTRPAPPAAQNGTANQQYTDIFVPHVDSVNNNIPYQNQNQNQIQQEIPSINIIQTTPDLTQATTLPQASYFPEHPRHHNQNQYFNDEDLYYNHNLSNSPENNGRSSVSMNSSIDNFDENLTSKPILQQQQNQYILNDDPLQYHYQQQQNPSSDFQNEDPEAIYVDQHGDDYPINSYLNNQGEIVDPYTRTTTLSSEIPSAIPPPMLSHRDLGEYEVEDNNSSNEDANTIDKIRLHTTSKSAISLNSSSSLSQTSQSNLLDESIPRNDSNRWLPKRTATQLRRFKLWNGNFIFDSPISKTLISRYSTAQDSLSNEFKFMRYQAVTCEPNHLLQKNFTVRQLKYLTPRPTELFIVITMYNEDHILLGRTLKGVMDNVKCMVKKTHSSTWGPDAWKKIVVCVVSDGRSKINPKSLALMSSLGCYQDGFAKDEINDEKVQMHVYEHTTMCNITNVNSETGIDLECNSSTVPIQLMFCLKEQNQKKINSHRWAFEGFAELLQPNVVTLLDAGTMPGKDSIYQLWREFRSPNVGGACGEIKADLGKNFTKLLNPLVASQNFEYKMSNILDKTTESNFGFITVLPGAFSAYRFDAVRGEPLQKYFYGETVESEGTHFFSSNMYLAEDRILCFEIVTKKHSNWVLKYSKSAFASTDVPETIPEFILQRRRWLNGSLFASIYSFCHFYRIWTSGHNIGRKLLLNFEFIYLFFNTLMSWFSLSSFFLVFRILTLSIALTYRSPFGVLSVVFLWLYGVSIFSTFILSLGNKPKSTEKFYILSCLFFAVLMIYMTFCSIFMSVKSFENILNEENITFRSLFLSEAFRDMIISMASTYALYLLSSIVYLQPWHMLTSFVQYLLFSPSYINVLTIYAFCNVHDISWGTKGAVAQKPLGKINTKEDGTFQMEILVSSEEIQANYDKYMELLTAQEKEDENSNTESVEEKKTGYYANVRSLVIIFWVMTNFAIVAVVLETGGIGEYLAMKPMKKGDIEQTTEVRLMSERATTYFAVILWLVALSALIRFIGCISYVSTRSIRKLLRR
ncbi:chitin synthase I NDAI_0F03480 [Naumovozyma dairenensis CBS 421]|uniref:chitin synthase n=1 Tax=Naumovozyma dairenensis (strain ATCC 10597 / BCRC 20456 / CBS 421 / NBRC 0211 / NRRL Y-12639) TaxID=1071378 RepID=G0WD05_NAUDC|nr:hypothetical protein NDAI_0F03480 [Naumovozyma dairenensis CBS 421]CCD25666.1 hypothetical protein NDAI_0F03480 [Naumovozyma dairenensis CBS 421]